MTTKTKVHTVYKTQEGKRVPSVTTILGVLGKPALIEWAWKMGLEGQDYKKVRDEAGDAGTLAHYLILCHLRGEEPDTSEYAPAQLTLAENSFLSYLEWERVHKLDTEMVEEPLVSEVNGFGGTADWVGFLDDKFTLIDFKTGKAIYSEMIYQVAAYKALLTERSGYPAGNVKILRIPREETEAFEERLISKDDLEYGWQIFQACLKIYQLQKLVRKQK
ncbi:MAG: hypothetical protein HQ578_06840 [Chloroflexi bacterium]|nr:hypothetical protein [Chloroflexota bacterium]